MHFTDKFLNRVKALIKQINLKNLILYVKFY